ncbi:hypothetical protein PCANC_09516 [Puccinia coronata f. sp. avenae]|uniref:Uncharacterized protein n=1 Tax=Puccinia coronata f. sp. avenae TaxID=200324 RepID=A0A2N5V4Z4_9BASI|nr:hypothetical protein PCANC_18439 [Puccinia coronata f. sp. avenae]PLW27501.1 hypothetical protein PCASD_17659 [Puccinia coronata f. sp. avenae]PLW45069.1 hypothetical protein PCANC_09516 [Puccinia coronata f. sp. avenae]
MGNRPDDRLHGVRQLQRTCVVGAGMDGANMMKTRRAPNEHRRSSTVPPVVQRALTGQLAMGSPPRRGAHKSRVGRHQVREGAAVRLGSPSWPVQGSPIDSSFGEVTGAPELVVGPLDGWNAQGMYSEVS